MNTSAADRLEFFKATYNRIDRDCLELLDEIYHPNIVFIDPFTKIEGLEALKHHFEGLYENLIDSEFQYLDDLEQGDRAMVVWEMTYRHSRVGGKRPVTFEGSSLIRFENDKVIHHRDYFDAGSMLYEHLPVLGSAIRSLKKRL